MLNLSVYQPNKPDKNATDPKSWIATEWKKKKKFSATGAYKNDIPSAVYSNFNFMRTELESGWFAVQMVPDDMDDYGQKQLSKVCAPFNDYFFITKFPPILTGLNWLRDAIVFIRGDTSFHSARPRKIPGWIVLVCENLSVNKQGRVVQSLIKLTQG